MPHLAAFKEWDRARSNISEAEVQRTRGDSVVFLERAQTLTVAINLDSDGGVLDTDAGL